MINLWFESLSVAVAWVYNSYKNKKKNTIKFKLFYIFVTPLCDMIRAHSLPPVYALNLCILSIKVKLFRGITLAKPFLITLRDYARAYRHVEHKSKSYEFQAIARHSQIVNTILLINLRELFERLCTYIVLLYRLSHLKWLCEMKRELKG